MEYEVYYNFTKNNLTKLNLTVCKNIEIAISIPKEIPMNELDKYNKSSGYYNDICYTLTNDLGLDVPLIDRRNDLKKNNLSVCEENCEFTGYNPQSKKVICSCFAKLNLPLISEIKVDKKKLFENFKDIRNIGNFKMLLCIKLFLSIKIFINLSNYMLVLIFILGAISIYVFVFYDYKKIKETIFNKNNNEQSINKKIEFKNIIMTNNDKNIIDNDNKNSNGIVNTVKKNKNKKRRSIKNSKNANRSLDNSNRIMKEKEKNFNNVNDDKSVVDNKLIVEEKFESLNDLELSELNYEEALEKDKRNFKQLYLALIRRKNLLIFSFFY